MVKTTRWRLHRLTISLALALGLSCGAPAQAAPGASTGGYVLGSTDQIASILRAADYKVEIKTDNQGLPYIQSSSDDRTFRIFFYDCDEGVRLERCLSAQFFAAFTIGRPFPLDRMNEWNRTHRFARGYVDGDQDAAIEMDVNMAADGMPAPLFKDTLDLWVELFRSFDDFVFATPDPDKPTAAPDDAAEKQ